MRDAMPVFGHSNEFCAAKPASSRVRHDPRSNLCNGPDVQYLDHAIWTALVSGFGAIFGGCVMLPTLARDDMRKTAADTLRAIGVTVSGCARLENLLCTQAVGF